MYRQIDANAYSGHNHSVVFIYNSNNNRCTKNPYRISIRIFRHDSFFGSMNKVFNKRHIRVKANSM